MFAPLARRDHRKSKFGLRHSIKLNQIYCMTKPEFWFLMIPPSKRTGNVRSWSDPVVVTSNPRARAARAPCITSPPKIYEILCARAARALCTSFLLLKSTVPTKCKLHGKLHDGILCVTRRLPRYGWFWISILYSLEITKVITIIFRWIKPFWYFCCQKQCKASLALYRFWKQKYQKGFIHWKIRVRTSERSVLFLRPI